MSAEAIQKAVFDALDGAAAVTSLVQGIYDNPNQVDDSGDNSEFPYITVGDAQIGPWDTDTETGFDSNIVIHVWSRAHHHLECKEIQDAIYATLHRQDIAVTGFDTIGLDMLNQDAQRDPDAITIHGVQDFRLVIEPE